MATDWKTSNDSTELMRRLSRAGFDDVLLLDHDTARRVLTERRQELLDRIKDGDVDSVCSLADDLDRDKAAVSRDLDTLFEYGLIEYDHEEGRKIPKTKHETVFVKPIL